MATIDDINAQKTAAVALLDQQIMNGITEKNLAKSSAQASQLDFDIHALMVRRSAVFVQAYAAGLNAPEMQAALDKLSAATAEMNTVAAQMVSVTAFIDSAADLGAAADNVVAALKGS